MCCNKIFPFLAVCRFVSASAGKMDIGGKIRLSLDYIGTRYRRNWRETLRKILIRILGDFWRKDYLKYIVSYRKFIRSIEIAKLINFRNEISLERHFISLPCTMTKYQNADIFGTCVHYWYNLFLKYNSIFIFLK